MRNPSQEQMLDLEKRQAMAQLADAQYKHESAKIRVKYQKPDVDSLLSEEEKNRMLDLKMRAEAAATDVALYYTQLRVELKAPTWAVLTPEGQWVTQQGEMADALVAKRLKEENDG